MLKNSKLPVCLRKGSCIVLRLIMKTNIEIIYWKLMKSGMFNFIKVKNLLFLIKTILFLTSLTISLKVLVNKTLNLNNFSAYTCDVRETLFKLKNIFYTSSQVNSRVRVQLGPSPVNHEKNTNRLNKWFRFI